MKSWKTTIGGAFAALGTFLWGAPVAIASLDLGFKLPNGVTVACVLAGLIMSGAGLFLATLFAADNSATIAMLNRNNLNTTPLTPVEAKDTKPSPSE